MLSQAVGVARAMHEANILPAPRDLPLDGAFASWGENLLPPILAAWRLAAAGTWGAGVTRRAGAMVDWLEQQQAAGAALTLGMPGAASDVTQRWLGPRLAWWPRRVAGRRYVGLASSRLGRTLDARTTWFAMLRAACAKIDRQADLLVTARRTTLARFAPRAAALFHLPALMINTPRDETLSTRQWFRQIRGGRGGRLLTTGTRPAINQVWLSPSLMPATTAVPDATVDQSVPLRDRALVAVSTQLLVCHVRPRGHLWTLLKTRLRDPAWDAASVLLALGPDLVPPRVADELLDLGAVGWMAPNLPPTPTGTASTAKETGSPSPPASGTGPPLPRAVHGSTTARPVVPVPASRNWPYLSHSTRRQDGPWPDQEEEDHLDDLILSRPDAAHSALAALCRIVRSRRLIATGRTIRGGTRVVSFTDVPLAQLGRLRVFRPHRGRWDFQPYGICIHRWWLERLETRPVAYGDEALWKTLSPAQRPFFQLRQTRARGDVRTIDWTAEREWRHVGDVDLSRLPSDAGLLFVPAEQDARTLLPISPWPVTVLDNG